MANIHGSGLGIKILLGVLVFVDAVTSATWKCLLFVVVYFSVTVLFYTYNSFPFDEKCKN